MKKFIFAASLFLATTVQAAPQVIFSFGSEELEEYFKERKHSQVIQMAAEELFGKEADNLTIAIIGDYGLVEKNSRCVYSVTAFLGRQYNGHLIIDMSQVGISRSTGTHQNVGKNCVLGVENSIQYVSKESLEYIRLIVETKKQIPKTNPKSHRTL